MIDYHDGKAFSARLSTVNSYFNIYTRQVFFVHLSYGFRSPPPSRLSLTSSALRPKLVALQPTSRPHPDVPGPPPSLQCVAQHAKRDEYHPVAPRVRVSTVSSSDTGAPNAIWAALLPYHHAQPLPLTNAAPLPRVDIDMETWAMLSPTRDKRHTRSTARGIVRVLTVLWHRSWQLQRKEGENIHPR
jgi:hypothetical protein